MSATLAPEREPLQGPPAPSYSQGQAGNTSSPFRYAEAHPTKDYPTSCASSFGEYFAHRLRWSHAVNSRRRLKAALALDVHFLEADVSFGPLLLNPEVSLENTRRFGNRSSRRDNHDVKTTDGYTVIMAHYPTESSSDLSLETFIKAVLRHNERCFDGAVQDLDEASPIQEKSSASALERTERKSAFSMPRMDDEQAPDPRDQGVLEEASAFANDLNRELDIQEREHGTVVTACVGARRGHCLKPDGMPGGRTRKGVKLDFKLLDCVAPSVAFLMDIEAARKLGGHLWLNADIFAGPGALISPMDAKEFVRLCAEKVPEAVLSLSWGSSIISASRAYTPDMVSQMIELCMSPIVPRPLASEQDTEARNRCLAPAASCSHITFAVAAEFALNSSVSLNRLLDAVPGSSLTIFSGVGSLGITPATVHDIIVTYGKTRCFLDLRLAKSWRSCAPAPGACCVQ